MRGYPCRDIIRNPDACGPCKLNPANRKPQKPTSRRFAHIAYLAQMQAAGAVFHYSDLTPGEWQGLIALKAEQNKRELERIKSGENRN